MITLKNLNTKTECQVIPTVFPDGTSQVWKLDTEVLKYHNKYEIIWNFESESEIMSLIQLKYLIKHSGGTISKIYVPFLPYGRQDKSVDNLTTFALKPFLDLFIDTFGDSDLVTFDPHSKAFCMPSKFETLTPEKFVIKSLIHSQSDLICFPDTGAAVRYPNLIDTIIASKVRNQETGIITGHELLKHDYDLTGKSVLIWDDIADGSATFISISKLLKAQGAKNVDMFVSHGIFSKGVEIVKELGGIRNIYTTNSYYPSQEMLKKHSNVKIFEL